MKIRTVATLPAVAMLALCTSPTTILADTAMDACIEAFVAERVPKGRTVKVRKVESTTSHFDSPGAQRITLKATGAKSGAEVASASCVVASDGDSVSLSDTRKPRRPQA